MGAGEREIWLPLSFVKVSQPLDQRKKLVITCMISSLCHSVSELFAALWCYAAQISRYWCYSTTVSINFNGQADQIWPSDLGLHISTLW